MTVTADIVEQRAITRLCHLTPYQNLLHIAKGDGLRSTKDLLDDERAHFDQQDLERLDRHPNHICCSVQYPNVWYLRRRKMNATPFQRLFPDWVCLLIQPSHLWREDTLYCHRNAASSYGAYVGAGRGSFERMFADPVQGANGMTLRRANKPASCPTDDQAEVLVCKSIPFDDVLGVAVVDDAQGGRVVAGLDIIGFPIKKLNVIVAPLMFRTALADQLRSGQLPQERPWEVPSG